MPFYSPYSLWPHLALVHQSLHLEERLRNRRVGVHPGMEQAVGKEWARHLLQCMMTQIAAATLEGAAQWCHPHMASTSSLLCLPVQVEEVDVVCAKTAQAGLTGSTHMRAAAIKDQS